MLLMLQASSILLHVTRFGLLLKPIKIGATCGLSQSEKK